MEEEQKALLLGEALCTLKAPRNLPSFPERPWGLQPKDPDPRAQSPPPTGLGAARAGPEQEASKLAQAERHGAGPPGRARASGAAGEADPRL